MKSIKIKKQAKPKNPLQSELFKIKKDFLTRNYKNFTQWGAGLKILSELFVLIPDTSFWTTYKLSKPFPIFWLRKEEGKSFLLKQYDNFLNKKISEKLVSKREEKTYILEEQKIGADFEVVVKPKNLKDFLNE